jgi:hypothetical protein
MNPDTRDKAAVWAMIYANSKITIAEVRDALGLGTGLTMRAIWLLRRDGFVKGWPNALQ